MGKRNDLTIDEKQKKTKLLSEGLFTLEISNDLGRDHWMIKKAAENITTLRTRNKAEGFNRSLSRDERKVKWIIEKNTFAYRSDLWKCWIEEERQ